jgi:2-hydroxychromene-2-carboxylate isomerase
MSAPGPKLEFWYELASTYSYLSAMRIEALAEILSRPGLEGRRRAGPL